MNEKLNALYSISYYQVLLNGGDPSILLKPSIDDGYYPFLVNNFPFLCEALLKNINSTTPSLRLSSINILLFLIKTLECSIGEHIIDITNILFNLYPNEQSNNVQIPEDLIISALDNIYTQYSYISPQLLIVYNIYNYYNKYLIEFIIQIITTSFTRWF